MDLHRRAYYSVCSIGYPMTAERRNHDRWIAWILKMGVWLSAALLLSGVVLNYADPPANPSANLSLSALFGSMILLQLPASEAFLYTGIVMLIVTPILRVGTAAIVFVAERDWRFAGVSIAVMAVLLLEIILSLQ